MRQFLSRYVFGPMLFGTIVLSMIGTAYTEIESDPRAAVTATVTPIDLALVPWRPVAEFVGTTKGVMFNDLFLDRSKCEAFLKTTAFKQSYAGLVAFLAVHGGQALTAARCVQVPPSTPAPVGEPI